MNLTQLMKQAQQMQKKAAKKQAELDAEIHEFEGANQLIKGTIKGNLEIISLDIDQSLLNTESKDDLEALIMVSLNKTIKEITEKKDKAMEAITGGVKGLF